MIFSAGQTDSIYYWKQCYKPTILFWRKSDDEACSLIFFVLYSLKNISEKLRAELRIPNKKFNGYLFSFNLLNFSSNRLKKIQIWILYLCLKGKDEWIILFQEQNQDKLKELFK